MCCKSCSCNFLLVFCTHQNKQGRKVTKISEPKPTDINATQTGIWLPPPHHQSNNHAMSIKMKKKKPF